MDDGLWGLGLLDLLVLLGYFALLGGIAWWTRPRTDSSEDYFLAGRSIPSWAAALSLMATALSAATFVGVPQDAYDGDLSYLAANLGAILAIIVIVVLFIPAFYRSSVTTVYDLLADRYGPQAARAASATFLVGRVCASGARLWIAGLALAFLISPGHGNHPWLVGSVIVLLVITACIYVFFGGIRSVIWTDVAQAGIFVLAAAVTLAVLLHRIPLDLPAIIDHLQHSPVGEDGGHKLTVFKSSFTDFSPGNRFGLLAIILGMSLINIGAYGTDQDLAQRLLTCRSPGAGMRSAILAVVAGIPVVVLFSLVGSLLWVFYQSPGVMGAAAPDRAPIDSAQVFLAFAVQELPAGLAGLIAAGLAAAAISGLTSELNAISSSLVADWFRARHPDADDLTELRVARFGIVGAALALAGVACIITVVYQERASDSILAFAFKSMTLAYSGLVGVFLCRLLTHRGNWRSVIAALITGFILACIGNFGHWSGRPITDTLAFPYVMFIATLVAFLVCLSGRPDGDRHAVAAASG
jgi:SSS family transporter